MLSMMMRFEDEYENYIRHNHPGLSAEDIEALYWLTFFMTFINNRFPSWTYHFMPGMVDDVYFLLKFVKDTKKYNNLLNSTIGLEIIDAELYPFYLHNDDFTKSLEFKEFIKVVSEPSFEAKIRSVFPEQPQQ